MLTATYWSLSFLPGTSGVLLVYKTEIICVSFSFACQVIQTVVEYNRQLKKKITFVLKYISVYLRVDFETYFYSSIILDKYSYFLIKVYT